MNLSEDNKKLYMTHQGMSVNERITDLLRDRRTQLPTLPVVAQNILTLTRDEKSSADDLAEFINKDQAIANKVLRLANSSYYGMGRKVDSITRAITIIGFNEIVGLTVGIGVFPAITGRGIKKSVFDIEGLWFHSIASCFASKKIYNLLEHKGYFANRGTMTKAGGRSVFLTSLLHDIGKVFFVQYFPEEYENLLRDAEDREIPLQDVEKEYFGYDHAEIATALMEYWNFPEQISGPVYYHHKPTKCPVIFEEDALILSFADVVVKKANLGQSSNNHLVSAKVIKDKLGFSDAEIIQLIQAVNTQKAEIEDFLQLIQ